MKRPNRSFEVFSLSALDLFASAMGAFIIITLIIFPYYSHRSPAEDNFTQINSLKSKIEAEAEETAALAESLEKEAKAARSDAPTDTELEALEGEVAQLRSETTDVLARLDGLAEEFERGMPFSILGVETQATKVVILVDLSGSMDQYAKIMSQTLERILIPFTEDTELAIIGFQTTGGGPLLTYWPAPQQMRVIDEVAKKEVGEYVKELVLKFQGGTPTYPALLEALKMGPDAIFLLSDGAPNNSQLSWQGIVQQVERQNRLQTKIHTVALGNYTNSVNLVAFLRDLATQSGGSFIGIDR